MIEDQAGAGLLELDNTSPAAIDAFLAQIKRSIAEDDGSIDWRRSVQNALRHLDDRRDIQWARLKLLEGGRNERISGAPLNVGRWLGLDPVAVEIARTQGTEDDFCATLLVYEWLSLADAEALVERSRTWSRTHNISRAQSVAAETMMYRHGAFDRACEVLEMQLSLHEPGVVDGDTGSIVEQAKSLVRMTMARLAAGELAEAIATRERAKEMVDRLGPGFVIYEHAGTKSGGDLYPGISMESNFAWYVEGDWQAVADHWVYAVGLDEPGGSPVHIIEAAMAAQAYARLDQSDNAHRMLRELTPLLKRLQPRDWGLNGAVGRSSHAIWDMEATEYAKDHHELALALLRAGVGDWTNTSLDLTVARMAALLGRADEARDYFARARSKLSRKRVDPRVAIIDFDEAKATRILDDAGSENRDALLTAADRIFRDLGMGGWSARLATETGRG